MGLYLLKVMTCSAAFYLLYHLVFQREKMFVFNRFYLLGTLLLSFFIPTIRIHVQAPASFLTNETHLLLGRSVIPQETIIATTWWQQIPWIEILLLFWGLVATGLLIRFCYHAFHLRKQRKRSELFPWNGVYIALSNETTYPHSFLQTIYLNKEEYNAGSIENEVLEHERAHIRQYHSIDILFIELMKAVFWFNPVLIFYKRAIQTNHELLADASVVKERISIKEYQQVLLHRITKAQSFGLASTFNFKITKKRFLMLQKKTNYRRAFLKSLLIFPLLAVLVFAFYKEVFSAPEPMLSQASNSDVRVADSVLSKYEKLLAKYKLQGDVSPADFVKRQGDVSATDLQKMSQLFMQLSQTDRDKNRVGFIKSQSSEAGSRSAAGYTMVLQFAPPSKAGNGVSEAEMKEYRDIFKKYEVVTNGRKKYKENFKEELPRILELYNRMTEAQRRLVPELPPPPPPPPAPAPPMAKATPGLPPPPPPPPPPFLRESQMKFDEWPVIMEVFDGKNTQIYHIKNTKVPEGFKNMVLKVFDNKIPTVMLIQEDFNTTVEDVSTPDKKKAFEKKYGLVLPTTIPQVKK